MDIFRNLCIDGGYDICAEMYNKHIMSPLMTFIPKVRGLASMMFRLVFIMAAPLRYPPYYLSILKIRERHPRTLKSSYTSLQIVSLPSFGACRKYEFHVHSVVRNQSWRRAVRGGGEGEEKGV